MGKEKLKRVSCTQKNGLELVHPERVRPGEAQNGGLGEKNVSQRKTAFKACGALINYPSFLPCIPSFLPFLPSFLSPFLPFLPSSLPSFPAF